MSLMKKMRLEKKKTSNRFDICEMSAIVMDVERKKEVQAFIFNNGDSNEGTEGFS